jgi:two-component system response regulator NreC
MINILIVERDILIEDLLRRCHKLAYTVGGKTNDPLEAIRMLSKGLKVSIVLMDITTKDVDYESLMDIIRWLYPPVSVITVSNTVDKTYIENTFKHGARGYLTNDITCPELTFGIEHVAGGNRYLSTRCTDELLLPSILHPVVIPELKEALTDREIDVLKLVALGLNNQEIGEKLFISKRTAEGHRQQLLHKTSSKNTAMLIGYGIANKLVS